MLLPLAVGLALGAGLHAAPTEFSFEDPKGVNHVVFMLDAPLEFISGTGKGVAGTISFDPENPAMTEGTITLSVASLSVPNPTMEDHMHGDDWLDASENPMITFTVDAFEVEESDGNRFQGTARGSLTLMGETNEIAVPATITHIEDGAGRRNQGAQGDLLVVRSDFTIKLSDYGLNIPAPARLKVSDQVQLRVVMAGIPPQG